VLADELSRKLRDAKHFGFYLKMATLYDHAMLRKLCGEILESQTVKTPGKLFAFLIKKKNQETKNTTSPPPSPLGAPPNFAAKLGDPDR
jgi:hypothetical protein